LSALQTPFAWLALVWPVCFVTVARTEPEDRLESLRLEAEKAQKAGQWEKARDCYAQLLAKQRTRADYQKHFLHCHRLANLVQRHRDSTYREQLAESDLRAAVRIYREVLAKLRANYIDPEKTDYSQLFQHGLDELRLCLHNEVFRQERLPTSVTSAALQAFAAQLDEHWSGRLIQNQRELETEVTRIAQAARLAIELEPTVTVLEFACGACHGLDQHTVFLTPNDLLAIQAALSGDTIGVGIDVEVRDRKAWISHVHPKSPAAAAGLEKGDQIVRIDGIAVDPVLDPVVDRLRGEEGAVVDISVLKADGARMRTVSLSREPLRTPSVVHTQIIPEQPGIAYCQIFYFQKSTAQELDDAIVQLQMQGMKALIVDLRSNSGGYLPAAIQVAERFLPEGKVIVTTESHVPDQVRIYRSQHPTPLTLPLVVLVDGETASAAEVVAGSLHAHRRATLVGTPTFGKWSMQRVMELKSGRSGIRVTLARFLSPGAEPYTVKGVVPDVVEERSAISMADNQLLVAIQLARGLIEMRP
jgi:carboxyl-terminal processing protease